MRHATKMTLTREFKETVKDRVASDPAFCRALLEESVSALLEGDLELGKAVLSVASKSARKN